MMDPLKQIEEFNHHRFENYCGWLDLEERKKQKARKIFFGEEPTEALYGYEPPSDIVVKERAKSPFRVDERAFASGEVVSRTYDKNFALNNSDFEAVRTDPFHYPNTVGCTAKSHWGDYRSGSRNPYFIKESLRRPLDEELYNSVPEAMVQQEYYNMKNRGHGKPMNADIAKILFAPDIDIQIPKSKKRPTSPEIHSVSTPVSRTPQLAREWSNFRVAKPPKVTRDSHSVPALRRRRSDDKVLVTSTEDDPKKSAHLRMQGGMSAKLGWAGSWSCHHGGGPGISEFSMTPPPLVTFW